MPQVRNITLLMLLMKHLTNQADAENILQHPGATEAISLVDNLGFSVLHHVCRSGNQAAFTALMQVSGVAEA